MKLLLLDPLVLVRERLGAVLATLDCVKSVETADTIEEAIRVMQSMRPEIVIMDSHLPDRTGVGALARLKSEWPTACVIVLSYDLSETVKKHWLEAGADYCFDIALQTGQLLDTVAQQVNATASVPGTNANTPLQGNQQCLTVRLYRSVI